MGKYESAMIGIRLGGVFSGDADMADVRKRIVAVLNANPDSHQFGREGVPIADGDYLPLSGELSASKGSYAVLAGVFKHWGFEAARDICSLLSKEFGYVMQMGWDEDSDLPPQCELWIEGKPFREAPGHGLLDTMDRMC